jgi:hypothetical protein
MRHRRCRKKDCLIIANVLRKASVGRWMMDRLELFCPAQASKPPPIAKPEVHQKGEKHPTFTTNTMTT